LHVAYAGAHSLATAGSNISQKQNKADENSTTAANKPGWANYGPRVACAQRGHFVRPAGQPHLHR